MTEAFITAELIKWARKRHNLSPDAVAKKVNVGVSRFSAWENGDARPTLNQARNLAQKLNIPFGYLYLSTPPTEDLPLPDLRRVAGASPRKPSPEFLDVLQDALRKQQWYHEYLESEDAPPLDFVGRFRITDEVTTVAADVRNMLSIDDDLRNKVRHWEQFLTEFIRKAEGVGVLVLRNGVVGSNTHRPLDVEEFRGFAISDTLAPLVFINSKDAKTAQIFTLAHELAHLWIGESGVSNPDYSERPDQQENAIDRHCDSVAAEVLVPGDDFVARWNDFTTLEDNLNTLVHRYRVSAFVILRRAFEYEKVQSDTYRTKLKDLLRMQKRKDGDGGGNFYTNVLTRNSNIFTTTLITATVEGRVPPREAASLLNVVNLATFRKIETHLLGAG